MALLNIPTTGLWSVIAGYLNDNFTFNKDLADTNAANVTSVLEVMKTSAGLDNTVKTNGVIPIVLTGTGDASLPPPDNPQPLTGGAYNGYKKVTGLQAVPNAGGYLTVASSEFIVGVGGTGSYHSTHAWVDISADANASVIGFVFAIERAGMLTFSQRPAGMRAAAQALPTNISGGGFLDLVEGDKLSLWVAASASTTLSLYDLNLGIRMSISTALAAL